MMPPPSTTAHLRSSVPLFANRLALEVGMERTTKSVPRLREKSLGRYGEDVAARYLQDSGLVLIDRNWRGPSGEIDLIAPDGEVLWSAR